MSQLVCACGSVQQDYIRYTRIIVKKAITIIIKVTITIMIMISKLLRAFSSDKIVLLYRTTFDDVPLDSLYAAAAAIQEVTIAT